MLWSLPLTNFRRWRSFRQLLWAELSFKNPRRHELLRHSIPGFEKEQEVGIWRKNGLVFDQADTMALRERFRRKHHCFRSGVHGLVQIKMIKNQYLFKNLTLMKFFLEDRCIFSLSFSQNLSITFFLLRTPFNHRCWFYILKLPLNKFCCTNLPFLSSLQKWSLFNCLMFPFFFFLHIFYLFNLFYSLIKFFN